MIQRERIREEIFDMAALAVTVATSLVLIGWVLWCCRLGFDLMDEGYYLNWISNPGLYKASVFQFGFIYHPLYRLIGGDIALLRQINILVTLGLGWALCITLFRAVQRKKPPAESWPTSAIPTLGISLAIATCSISFLIEYWLPTPSYNTLALQGLLIVGIGMLLADINHSRASILGWILIGFGGWLSFMAKPTTAAALGLVVGCYLLLAGKFKTRMLLVPLVTVAILGILTTWCIDGSLQIYVKRMSDGMKDAKLLDARYTLSRTLRLDKFSLGKQEKLALILTMLLALLGIFISYFYPRAKQVGPVVVFLFFLGCVADFTGLFSLKTTPTKFQGMQYWAAFFAALIATLAIWRKERLGFSRNGLAIAVCFIIFPHVYAIGTNNNYWEQAEGAAVFWVLAGIAMLASVNAPRMHWRTFLPIAALAQAITVVLIHVSMEHPYRQLQPLRKQRTIVRMAGTGAKIIVSSRLANYLHDLDRLAKTNGFNVGDPMIDLTGYNPGALYAIGAKAIGQPWICGSYRGSENFAIAALGRVSPEELGKAWVLTEPKGSHKISLEILRHCGIDPTKDYSTVGVLRSSPRGAEQYLLKPIRSSDYPAPAEAVAK